MRVERASGNVETYTKLGNPTRSEDMLDYGPFRDIPAYNQVHHENNSHFLIIPTMTPVMAVSHCGRKCGLEAHGGRAKGAFLT
jgi:oligosaccharyltransferase complex subunit alpha (ribophorin I)